MWVGVAAQMGRYFRVSGSERQTMGDNICAIDPIGHEMPDVTVFNTAWLIEKDLSEFYAKMAEQTEGRTKEALTMLSDWEKEHERFFREFRDKLSEVYSQMPWGG